AGRVGRTGRVRARPTAKLGTRSPSIVWAAKAVFHRHHTKLDFLCHDSRVALDVLGPAIADRAGGGARAFSHRESIRPLWHHDQGPVRNRVPGFRRWKNLGSVSLPLQ